MIIFSVFLILLVFTLYATERERDLSEDARTIDNVYVLSRHPEHRLESTIINESTMSPYVVWERYEYVRWRVDKEKLKLSRSGNALSVADCRVTESIKVIAIIFQDGERANETWAQYEQYALNFILEDRKKRHNYLKRKYPDWYDQWGNMQL